MPPILPGLLRDPLRTSLSVTQAAWDLPGKLARRVPVSPPSAAPAAVAQRQVWAVAGLAMMEVRGFDRRGLDRAAPALRTALTGTDGISWARVDVPTARVAVRYDNRRLTVSDLVTALTYAEAGTPAHPSRAPEQVPAQRRAPVPPPVPAGMPVDTVVLVADLAVAVATSAGRLARLPRLPAGSPAVVALVEHQPWLRDRIGKWIGSPVTDLTISLTDVAVHGLTGNVAMLLLDAAERSLTVLGDRATRAALAGREPDQRHRPGPDERPRPVPPGPVERLIARMGPGSLLAAGAVLGTTANLDLAGRALLVGIPRAATAARDGFADSVRAVLARHGVLALEPGALRRLDKLTAVVVDSQILHTDRLLVIHAEAHDGWPAQRVWREAQRLLDSGREAAEADRGRRLALLPPDDSDPPPKRRDGTGLTRLLVVRDGASVGEVLVGRELDPLADAVLSAVREARLRLVLTEDLAAGPLGSRADEVLRPRGATAGTGWLRAEVRRLQAEGQVVAVISADEDALDAADVGIGLAGPVGRVPWTADLLCGPGLHQLPRLIAAVAIAREITERGVRRALGASFLGGLLLAVPGRAHVTTAPITLAAASALYSALRAARAVDRHPDPMPVSHTPWHGLAPDEVLARLPDPGPVSGDDPARRPTRPMTAALRNLGRLASNVRAELDDPLTPVLATGAVASAVIGSPTDSLLVGGVLLGSAVISGSQRMRADRALRALLLDQRVPARVVDLRSTDRTRGGSGAVRTVPAARLQPGHILDLQAGDVVPADARLLLVDELEVDEATLTGESTAVTKHVEATPGADLPDRVCMIFEGTTVIAGTGRAVVVAVGAATEAGRALALAGRAGSPAGMQARLEELTRLGLPVTLAGGTAVTALALMRGMTLRTAIASGVSVAVAAVPEGLPLMATVAQLGAARRLSRRGVLVRSARTVEALGRVSTICFDKTGTLTEGRLRLVRVSTPTGEAPPDAPSARRTLRTAAQAGPRPNGAHGLAHATDQAVRDAAEEILGKDLDHEWEELAELPFHSGRKYSAALGRTPSVIRLVLKGAPEVLLPRCSHVRDDAGKRPLDRAGRERAGEAIAALAGQGLRVLAVARRNVTAPGARVPDPEDVAGLGDLTLLGFIGLADTPRPQAAATVRALRAAGIRPVMITGDHPVTARAVADGLGIPADDVVTGPELAGLDEDARAARVRSASVFARVSPEQKLHIVSALQRTGEVVAMAGDGANDAAAIRAADVGIGMAAKGSTSARTAADLVLTEPDIGLVIDALVEGRAMWRRVRDGVAVLLGGNAGELLFTLVGTALAGRAPISTRQFLVVNMFTDLLPSMALALAPTPTSSAERTALLTEGPPSLGRPLLRDIGIRGTVTACGALVAWLVGRFTGTRRRAGTIALATLVGTELGQTLLLGGRRPLVVVTSIGSVAVLAAVIQLPVISTFFGCTPLGPLGWATVLTCATAATVASAALPRILPRPTQA